MEENEILALGFEKHEWEDEGNIFTEYVSGMIYISGLTLVEIKYDHHYITVPNCNTIEDLKQLIKLFI